MKEKRNGNRKEIKTTEIKYLKQPLDIKGHMSTDLNVKLSKKSSILTITIFDELDYLFSLPTLACNQLCNA